MEASIASQSNMMSKLYDRSLKQGYCLIFSRFISFFGSGVYQICFPLFILAKTGSLAQTGFFFSITFFPSVLLIPMLGVWLEKQNLKRCLILSDLFSAFLFFLLYLNINVYGFSIVVVSLITILLNINTQLFSVTSSSIFIHVIQADRIEKANGIKSMFDNFSTLLAPLIGTFLYGLYGISTLILLNILSFAISAVIVLFLHYQHEASIIQKEKFFSSLKGGISYIKGNTTLFHYFLLIMALNLLVSPTEEIFAPGIVEIQHHISALYYGWTSTSVALGVIAASIYFQFRKKINRRLHADFLKQGYIMIVVGVISVLLKNNTFLFFGCYLFLCFLSGFFMTCVNIPLISSFQLMVEHQFQARFFSILAFFSNLMVPIGTYIAGLSSNALGADIAYAINGLCIILIIHIVFQRIQQIPDEKNVIPTDGKESS